MEEQWQIAVFAMWLGVQKTCALAFTCLWPSLKQEIVTLAIFKSVGLDT